MNRKAIISALEKALDENGERYQAALLKATQRPVELADTLFNYDLCEPVKNALEAQEEFQTTNPLYVFSDGACGIFDSERVSSFLISRVRKTGNMDLAVDWLEKVLCTKRAVGQRILALWGITVTDIVHLTEELDFIPISNLPESKMKEKVLNFQFERISSPTLPFEAPETALVCKVTIDPFISKYPQESQDISNNPYILRENFINEILLALTLIGPRTLIRYISWFQFEDVDLEDARLGQEISYSIPEIMPRIIKNYGAWDIEIAKLTINQYLQLKGTIKKKVQIALERLNQAMRRSNVGDQALEVSIALESLLSDGGSENTYKIGLRSSLLLGGEPKDMLHVRAIVGGTYVLRNALVHNGEANETIKIIGEGKKESKDVVDEAIIICSKIIRRVLELQEIPNWYEFELSN
jgi:hypothetical protein